MSYYNTRNLLNFKQEDQAYKTQYKVDELYTTPQQVNESCVQYCVSIITESADENVYLGSGFIIHADELYSYIVTAAHVVLSDDYDPGVTPLSALPFFGVNVNWPVNRNYFYDGVDNVVIGIDPVSDIAVIRIKATGLKVAQWEDSHLVIPGTNVSTIGWALGKNMFSFSRGTVRDPSWQFIEMAGSVPETLLTDIPTESGNSGGPIILDNGKVVGVTSYTELDGDGNLSSLQGAIGSYLAAPIVKYFIDNYNGALLNYPKGFAGVVLTPIDLGNATYAFGTPDCLGVGLLFDGYAPNPAEWADVAVIYSINGVNVGQNSDEYAPMSQFHLATPGSRATIVYSDFGNYNVKLTKTVAVTSFPAILDYLFVDFNSKEVKHDLFKKVREQIMRKKPTLNNPKRQYKRRKPK
jgi:S1-C subfamily serine protease